MTLDFDLDDIFPAALTAVAGFVLGTLLIYVLISAAMSSWNESHSAERFQHQQAVMDCRMEIICGD